MLGKHNFHLSRRTVEFGYLSPLAIYSIIKKNIGPDPLYARTNVKNSGDVINIKPLSSRGLFKG